MCNKLIYLELAAFLMDVYTYTLGKEGEELALALSTQRHYLRYMLHAAQREYGHLDQHKPFFGCLVAGASTWLSAAEVSVERAVTTACALAGTTVVTSATPVHRKHALEIARAYARFHGLNRGGDGVLKRLAIVLLWIAVGRTAEVAMLCFDLCEWDTHYNCLAIWWYQPKTSKFKKVLLAAGRDPALCPFDAYADAFASGMYRDQLMNETTADGKNVPAWALPGVAKLKDPGAAIGSWVQAVGVGSKNVVLECVRARLRVCSRRLPYPALPHPAPPLSHPAGPLKSCCPTAQTRQASASAGARTCCASRIARPSPPPSRATRTRPFRASASSPCTPSLRSRT